MIWFIIPDLDPVKYTEVSTVEDFEEMVKRLQPGEGIKLTGDLTLDKPISLSENGETVINLNGHELTALNTRTEVTEGQSLTLKNGKVNINNGQYNGSLYPLAGSVVTLDNVTMDGMILPKGQATLNIKNSVITHDGYAISTNASSIDNYGVQINIMDSKIVATSSETPPMLINIPSNVNIDNSTIEGKCQAVVVRGGDCVITNSTIINTTNDEIYNEGAHKYDEKDWGTGSDTNLAALVIGNKYPTSYQYPTNVKLVNTKVIANLEEGSTLELPTVYIISNTVKGLEASLEYDKDSVVGEVVRGNDYAIINGESYIPAE